MVLFKICLHQPKCTLQTDCKNSKNCVQQNKQHLAAPAQAASVEWRKEEYLYSADGVRGGEGEKEENEDVKVRRSME